MSPRPRRDIQAKRQFQGALGTDAAAGVDEGASIPAGADAGGSRGVPGAFTTTDAEGSEGSDAGVAKALAGAGLEEKAASCGCLEQAASANNNPIDRRNGPVFIRGGLSRSLTLLHRASVSGLRPTSTSAQCRGPAHAAANERPHLMLATTVTMHGVMPG